jgi:hypothetical protein
MVSVPLSVSVELFSIDEFATAVPSTVTASELLMTTLSDEVGTTPDTQSPAVDQSPDVPMIQYCLLMLPLLGLRVRQKLLTDHPASRYFHRMAAGAADFVPAQVLPVRHGSVDHVAAGEILLPLRSSVDIGKFPSFGLRQPGRLEPDRIGAARGQSGLGVAAAAI